MAPSQKQLEDWITQLDRELEELEHFWSKIPRWCVTVVVISVALVLFRPLWGVLAMLVGLSFVGTAAWILGVRRREHRDDIEISKERLERLYP